MDPERSETESLFLTVQDVRIRYVDAGPVEPRPVDAGGTTPSGEDAAGHGMLEPLVIIPGHTARIEGFDQLLPLLARHRRVLVLDLPGSGYSEKPEREYTLRYYEDTIIGFLDALGIERAIPVGGSLGGNLVLRLGFRFPERFPILVAWAPGGAWTARPRFARVLRRAGRQLFWPVVKLQSRYWYSRDYPGREQALRDTFAYYRQVMCPGFVRMYFGIAADQIGHSLFDIGRAIRQPTLLIVGEDDNGANMRAGVTRLSTMIPHCDFQLFPKARHSLETENPDELGQAIDAFLSRMASVDTA